MIISLWTENIVVIDLYMISQRRKKLKKIEKNESVKVELIFISNDS